MMNPTIKTIAQAAGVSTATVSKALNDMPDVSERTKERIRAIAREQGYMVNEGARQLASGASQLVGVVLPDIMNPVTIEIFRALSTRLERFDYSAHLMDGLNPARERECVRRLMEYRVRALVVSPCANGIQAIEDIVRDAVPIVYVCGSESKRARNIVVCDDYLGGRLAARHLYRAGCRNCAVYAAGSMKVLSTLRARGFTQYMRLHGASVELYEAPDCPSCEEAGMRFARDSLASGRIPDAVFATDDAAAAGAISVFRGAGLDVPKDISVIGYGDMPYAGLELIKLTSVRPPKEEIGMRAADMAVDLINNRPDTIHKVLLEPRLVQRDTAICK